MFKSFSSRLSIVFFLSSALVLVGMFTFFYFRITKLRERTFTNFLENFTRISTNLVPGEDVRAISLKPGCDQTPEGLSLIKKLRSIREVNKEIFDVYVMVPSEDPDHVRFVTNADRERTPVGCGELYDIRGDPAIRIGFQRPYTDLKFHSDRWGTWVSAYAPVKTHSGETVGVIGVDIARQTAVQIRREFSGLFIVSVSACLGLSWILGFLSSLWLTRPIRRVVRGMERSVTAISNTGWDIFRNWNSIACPRSSIR